MGEHLCGQFCGGDLPAAIVMEMTLVVWPANLGQSIFGQNLWLVVWPILANPFLCCVVLCCVVLCCVVLCCVVLWLWLWLWLLLLLFWTRVDEDTMRYVHTMLRINYASLCQVTWESDSRRLRHPGEPSTTKNSSSSRARKTGAQLRDNPEERENDAKCVKKPQPCFKLS